MKKTPIFNRTLALVVASSISTLFLATGCQSTVMEERENVPAAERELGFQKDQNLDQSYNNNATFSDSQLPQGDDTFFADTTVTTASQPSYTNNPPPAKPAGLPPMEDMSKDTISYNVSNRRVAPTAPTAAPEVYVVKRGDSIGGIAHKYGVKISDIVALNNIKNPNQIRIGQKIKLPSNARKTASNSNNSTGSSATATSYQSQVTNGLYVVKSGDSISKIASRLKIKRADLMAANNINENSILRIGQKLVIPGKDAAITVQPQKTIPVSTTTTPSNDDFNEMTRSLEIQSDAPATDSPTIEVENNTEVIIEAAPTQDVVTAPEIVAPATVFLEADMSVEDFCAKYNKTEQELINLNNPIPADRIFKTGTLIIL